MEPLPAGGGDGHMVVAAHEQVHTDVILHPGDHLTDSLLGEGHDVGGLGEIEGLGKRQEAVDTAFI